MIGGKHQEAVLTAMRKLRGRPATVQQISSVIGPDAPRDSTLYTVLERLLELGQVVRTEESVQVGDEKLRRIRWALPPDGNVDRSCHGDLDG